MIQNNYLHQDFEKVSNNLEALHKATMNVLKGSTAGDFDLIEKSQIEIEKTKKILYALHMKKFKRDEFHQVNNGIYARHGWLKEDTFETHYFTFGNGHILAGNCQPIIAKSPEEARSKMVEIYGSEWAFQYTTEEYKKQRAEGYGKHTFLDPIIAGGD